MQNYAVLPLITKHANLNFKINKILSPLLTLFWALRATHISPVLRPWGSTSPQAPRFDPKQSSFFSPLPMIAGSLEGPLERSGEVPKP